MFAISRDNHGSSSYDTPGNSLEYLYNAVVIKNVSSANRSKVLPTGAPPSLELSSSEAKLCMCSWLAVLLPVMIHLCAHLSNISHVVRFCLVLSLLNPMGIMWGHNAMTKCTK